MFFFSNLPAFFIKGATPHRNLSKNPLNVKKYINIRNEKKLQFQNFSEKIDTSMTVYNFKTFYILINRVELENLKNTVTLLVVTEALLPNLDVGYIYMQIEDCN